MTRLNVSEMERNIRLLQDGLEAEADTRRAEDEALSERISQAIIGGGGGDDGYNPEVIDARIGRNGFNYSSLKARIDAEHDEFAAAVESVNEQLGTDGESIEELQTKATQAGEDIDALTLSQADMERILDATKNKVEVLEGKVDEWLTFGVIVEQKQVLSELSAGSGASVSIPFDYDSSYTLLGLMEFEAWSSSGALLGSIALCGFSINRPAKTIELKLRNVSTSTKVSSGWRASVGIAYIKR